MNPEFSALMALVTLLADPEATKARLTELQTTIAAADARTAEAEAAHHELDVARARLAEDEKKVRAREVQVRLAEAGLAADLAKIEKHNREQRDSRLVQVGAGLTREPDHSQIAPVNFPPRDRHAELMPMRPVQARKTGRAHA